jgi:SsrA-binding protein
LRPRKLLLHKNQMNKLIGAVQRKGTTLIPLSIYFNNRGIAKVELGIATGKKQHDKRETEKKRDWQREKSRIMADKGSGFQSQFYWSQKLIHDVQIT